MIIVAVFAAAANDGDDDADVWPYCRRVSGNSSAFLSLCLSVSTSHLKIPRRACESYCVCCDVALALARSILVWAISLPFLP